MEANQIATKKDISELKEWLSEKLIDLTPNSEAPRILRTRDLKRILGISTSSIQNMRNNGTLPYSKVNGTCYYKWDDIERTLLKKTEDSMDL